MGSHQRSFFTELNPSSSTTSKASCSTEVVHEEENPMAQMWRTPSLKEFSFKDLIIASLNFSPDSLLCEGGFGRVYRGWVDEKTLASSSVRGIGMAVAIKVFQPSSNQQVFQEWQELPYHYLSIYGSKLPLERVKHYNAKLSDFGLAMLGPSTEEVPVSTGYAFGTIGYIAPKYITTGDLYLKSDVYGFGVVLLELLMGLRVTDPEHPRGEQNLVDWLKPILSQETKLKTIMDAQMEGQYLSEAALQAAQLSLRCLELDPQKPPIHERSYGGVERD